MAGLLDNIVKVVQFVVKFLFKLTANLVIELLKFGALTLILLVVLCVSAIAFVCVVRWTYVTSDGNLVYTLGVATGMVVTVVILLFVMQYIVKDMLKLTKMTILEFVLLWLRPTKKDKSNGTVKTGVDVNHSQTVTEKKEL